MTSYDCITVGDISLDRFMKLSHVTREPSTTNPGNSNLILEVGQKVPVDQVIESIGGNACNVAAGLQSLGLRVAVYSHIGTDDTSEILLHHFRDLGLSEELLCRHEGETTNSATIISLDHDRIILSYHAPRSYTPRALPEAPWLYLTSLGEGSDSLISQCLGECTNSSRKIAFNPGSHYMKHKLPLIRSMLPELDVLLVNKEEAQLILDTSEESIPELLRMLVEHQVTLPVITDGKAGAYTIDSDGTLIDQPAIPVGQLQETTGAGDAFASGFMSAYIQGQSLDQCLAVGAANSGSVITQVGATNGLLSPETLAPIIAEHTR